MPRLPLRRRFAETSSLVTTTDTGPKAYRPTHVLGSMNAHPGLGRPQSSAGSVGAPTDTTLSPVSSKGKRRRIQEDSSPGSGDDGYDAHGNGSDKRRQPGVKRACNECRQQKVSQERGLAPYTNICRGKIPTDDGLLKGIWVIQGHVQRNHPSSF